jgi:hypothetical protein
MAKFNFSSMTLFTNGVQKKEFKFDNLFLDKNATLSDSCDWCDACDGSCDAG